MSEQERNDFEPTENRADPGRIERGGGQQPADEQARDHGDTGDPRVAQPGEDPAGETAMPSADVGEAIRGAGQDRMGGYGNAPVAQEPGPDQDEGLGGGRG